MIGDRENYFTVERVNEILDELLETTVTSIDVALSEGELDPEKVKRIAIERALLRRIKHIFQEDKE